MHNSGKKKPKNQQKTKQKTARKSTPTYPGFSSVIVRLVSDILENQFNFLESFLPVQKKST